MKGKSMRRKIISVSVLLVILLVSWTVYAADLNFVVMGDNRPADEFRPEQPYIYYKAVKEAAALNPVLILNTGDLILGYDANSEDKAKKEFEDFEKATAPIREKNIPLYIAMGNHAGYTESARKAFAKRYGDNKIGKLYYSVDMKNCHFIILCSELENEEAQIAAEQLEWLKTDLKQADGKHIFVVLHRPLYPKIKHLKDSLNKYSEKRDELVSLLKQYNVDMVFAGHVHVYNFSVVSGLSQIIAGGSGAPLAGEIEDGAFSHFLHVIVDGDDVDYRLLILQDEVMQGAQLMEEGRVEGAISLAEKAIQTLPDHPMPHIMAAVGYKLTGQILEYNAEVAKLFLILKIDEEVLFRLGEFCLSAKQLDLANFYLSNALAVDNNSFKICYHYARLKAEQKKYQEALDMYKKALPLTDNRHYIDEIKEKIKEIEKLI